MSYCAKAKPLVFNGSAEQNVALALEKWELKLRVGTGNKQRTLREQSQGSMGGVKLKIG